jgi:hypothetical protein
LHRLGQAVRSGGWPDTRAAALKQSIAQGVAQARQALAGGRLRQAQLLRCKADAARAPYGIKQTQQVQVELVDIHLKHVIYFKYFIS